MTTPLKHTDTQHAPNWLFAALCLLTIVIYFPGLSGDYMFDDMPNLIDNKRLDLKSLTLESLQGAAYSSGAGTLRRPVSMLSFALNRYFFGIAPYSHKVTNLVIHLLVGIGIYLLSRLVVRAYRLHREPGLSAAAVRWLPLVVSGLWLVHPLNLTSVLYIVQRMTSLATLFMVFGLCLYMAGRLRTLAGKPGLHLILAGLLGFGGLALFSKENGVLLPLYMLVLELALFRFRDSKGGLDRSVIVFFIVTVALPAGLFVAYMKLNPGAFVGGYDVRQFTLMERILTEARVVVLYLKLILMPSISELGLHHDDITLSRGLLDPPATLYSFIGLGVMLLGALLLLGKRPLVSLGILWFFAGHALESTIFPLEIAHEHRNYLADYGIILALAALISQAPAKKMAPVIRFAAPCLFLLLFSYTTWLRASQWTDVVSHAVYESRHHPQSYRSVFNTGRVYARLALNGELEFEDKARDHMLRAAGLDKTEIMPYALLIQFHYYLGRPVDPAWFDEISYRLPRYPVTPSTLNSLKALAKCSEKKCGIPHDTVDGFFSLLFKKQNELAKNKVADAKTIYGYFSINTMGDFHKGLELFNQAVEHNPREQQRWINLINLLIVMERYNDAERKLELFRTSNTYGGNDDIYRELQSSIDEARKVHQPSAVLENPANG